MVSRSHGDGHYPEQVAIDAYGNGGFRFADMSHRGGLLCLPGQMLAWSVASVEFLTVADFAPVFNEKANISLMILGTGESHMQPPVDIIGAFSSANIGLEIMTTGSAARTYNILLGEKRLVGAALIAV